MNIEDLTPVSLAGMFDQTVLMPYAEYKDFDLLCEQSRLYGFKMVAINPAAVEYCKAKLKDCPVHVGAAIGFPLGQNTIESKVFETKDAIAKGSDEIDYVINITKLKEKDYDYIRSEMKQIVSICRENNVTSKVIFENCFLTDDEKIALCKIANEVKPDFIKTSTGFGKHGALVEDVELMRKYADPDIQIKAAGGIRNLDTAFAMIKAGATRIGTSSGVKIVEEFKQRLSQKEG